MFDDAFSQKPLEQEIQNLGESKFALAWDWSSGVEIKEAESEAMELFHAHPVSQSVSKKQKLQSKENLKIYSRIESICRHTSKGKFGYELRRYLLYFWICV